VKDRLFAIFSIVWVPLAVGSALLWSVSGSDCGLPTYDDCMAQGQREAWLILLGAAAIWAFAYWLATRDWKRK
jgi:hypothetical protein